MGPLGVPKGFCVVFIKMQMTPKMKIAPQKEDKPKWKTIEQDRVVNSSGSKMVNFHRTEAGLT